MKHKILLIIPFVFLLFTGYTSALQFRLMPQSDNSPMQFTCSSGTNHTSLVDEYPHNSDTDYVYTTTRGRTDYFNMFNLPVNIDFVVDNVTLYDVSKKAGGTSTSQRLGISLNWSQSDQQLQPLLTTSYVKHSKIYTGIYVWGGESEGYYRKITINDVNSCLFLISAGWLLGTGNIRCTEIYMNISGRYVPLVIPIEPTNNSNVTFTNGRWCNYSINYTYVSIHPTVYVYTNVTGSWVQKNVFQMGYNGTFQQYFSQFDTENKRYWWRIKIYDERGFTPILLSNNTFNFYMVDELSFLTEGILEFEPQQFLLLLLISLWLFFVFKYIDNRNDVNYKILSFSQFAFCFPLTIQIALFTYDSSNYFGWVVVFIIPIISLYLLIDSFYGKNK